MGYSRKMRRQVKRTGVVMTNEQADNTIKAMIMGLSYEVAATFAALAMFAVTGVFVWVIWGGGGP